MAAAAAASASPPAAAAPAVATASPPPAAGAPFLLDDAALTSASDDGRTALVLQWLTALEPQITAANKVLQLLRVHKSIRAPGLPHSKFPVFRLGSNRLRTSSTSSCYGSTARRMVSRFGAEHAAASPVSSPSWAPLASLGSLVLPLIASRPRRIQALSSLACSFQTDAHLPLSTSGRIGGMTVLPSGTSETALSLE